MPESRLKAGDANQESMCCFVVTHYSAGYSDCMLGLYDLSLLGYTLSFTFVRTAGELPEP